MKKELLRGIFGLIFVIAMISAASAELIIGQPRDSYNFGDDLNITISIIPTIDSVNYLSVKIACTKAIENTNQDTITEENATNETQSEEIAQTEESKVEILKAPYTIKAMKQKNIFILVNLDKALISDLEGRCFIEASYGNEEGKSSAFELTNNLDVNIQIANNVINPGEGLNVTGTAKKLSGKPLEGFAEIRIDNTNIYLSASGVVRGGKFSIILATPETIPAANYEIKATAYEKDDAGNTINEGNAFAGARVNRIVKGIDIAFNFDSIAPENELSYNVRLYDQSKATADGDIAIKFYKADDSLLLSKVVSSGEMNSLPVEYNYLPGYWRIEASKGEMKASKNFYVDELRKVSFSLENDTLIVTNRGNIPFEGPVEIKVGDASKVKEIKLDVDETKSYKLSAPDGEYNIEIKNGEGSEGLGSASLTGNAISISELGNVSWFSAPYLWIWIILIVVLAAVAIYYYLKKREGRIMAGVPVSMEMTRSAEKAGFTPEGKNIIDTGERQECAVISLKLKNLEQLEKIRGSGIEAIDRALAKAKEMGTRIYVSENFRLIILCPAITKESDNSFRAVNVAKQIADTLNEYNVSHAPKIEFGLGANMGEMIVESKAGKFKFVSIGNTMTIAKKISEIANKEALLSENIHRRVVGNVKSEKSKDGFWAVKRITNREAHSDFIDRFMNRQRRK